MPSPFPGMDPYLEGQRWRGFHMKFLVAIVEALTPQIRPRYIADVEEHVYVEHAVDERPGLIIPDVAIMETAGASPPSGGGIATRVAIEPVIRTVPMPERRTDRFLTLRDRETEELVTVIELLSPTNKRAGSDGRREYLAKRETVLLSPAHLVEIDLLRGGIRLPTNEPLPEGDYFAFVCRWPGRPRAHIYVWTLRHPLPTIPIPLAGDDPDVPLDLQAVFSAAFDRAGYDYALRRDVPVQPPLTDADAAWAVEVLKAAAAAGPASDGTDATDRTDRTDAGQ